MPVMKFHAPYEAAFLPFEVTAYMLHPDNETKRNAYLALKMAEYTDFYTTQDGIDSPFLDVIKDLVEKTAPTIQEPMKILCREGTVAGEILLYQIKLSVSHEDPSVGMAKHLAAKKLAAQYFSDLKKTDREKISNGNRTLWRRWSTYNSVAHLWAALQIQIQLTPDLSNLSSWDSYLKQLSLANELGKLKKTLKSNRAKQTDDADDAIWTLPSFVELPGCLFRCHGLDEEEREWMLDYKAPSAKKDDGLPSRITLKTENPSTN